MIMSQRVLTALCVALLSACFFILPACGGGGAKSNTSQSINNTTKGQELMDLKRAYDQGIISEREYNKQRERILDKK